MARPADAPKEGRSMASASPMRTKARVVAENLNMGSQIRPTGQASIRMGNAFSGNGPKIRLAPQGAGYRVLGQPEIPGPEQPGTTTPVPETAGIAYADAVTLLAGLDEILSAIEQAAPAGTVPQACEGILLPEDLAAVGLLRERLGAFVASGPGTASIDVSQAELDLAQKMLACESELSASRSKNVGFLVGAAFGVGVLLYLAL